MSLEFAAIAYRSIRDRIRAEAPQIDEQTLADTVEGLTDLHEIVAAVIRSVLTDEALATGLKSRIADMQDRLDRLQDRASKRRQIAKDVMVELDLKKITAPDFTISIRPGIPSLLVLDEAVVPSIFWQPVAPRLNRQGLLTELKGGAEIQGVALSNPEQQNRSRPSGANSMAGMYAPARPMVVSSPILKVGTRYQKPIGFLDLMAGTGRP